MNRWILIILIVPSLMFGKVCVYVKENITQCNIHMSIHEYTSSLKDQYHHTHQHNHAQETEQHNHSHFHSAKTANTGFDLIAFSPAQSRTFSSNQKEAIAYSDIVYFTSYIQSLLRPPIV